MNGKRGREEALDDRELIAKLVAVRASGVVVSIVTHDVPVEMYDKLPGYMEVIPPPKEVILFASGLMIECKPKDNSNSNYLCTILSPACLFYRPNYLNLQKIKIDVFGERGELYKGKLLACDFHYNLAAITITSNSLLPTATLKPINDVLSIDLTHQAPLSRHSNLVKILPGTQIISVGRGYNPPYGLYSKFGSSSSRSPQGFSCNELYRINNSSSPGSEGGPVLNSFGEIIGIVFNISSFLPSNIITRWWNHYKSYGDFFRPFLGMEVANLHDADVGFLAQFMTRFPKIFTGVIVTKVEVDSPACRSGLRLNDVIVNVDGNLVDSKMQFFETIWETTGESAEFKVLRVTDGEEWNLSLVVEEASPDKFHQWPHPGWERLR